MNGFFQTFDNINEVVDFAINKNKIVPALILIYSSIDNISVISTIGEARSSREVFKAWVKDWMLKRYPLPCNEVDIYAARCGLLHQHISESDLSNGKKAKQIYYYWGNKDANSLEKAIKLMNKENEIVAVKVEDLFWSFRRGVADCYEENSKDKKWIKSFKEKAKKLFVTQNDLGV